MFVYTGTGPCTKIETFLRKFRFQRMTVKHSLEFPVHLPAKVQARQAMTLRKGAPFRVILLLRQNWNFSWGNSFGRMLSNQPMTPCSSRTTIHRTTKMSKRAYLSYLHVCIKSMHVQDEEPSQDWERWDRGRCTRHKKFKVIIPTDLP